MKKALILCITLSLLFTGCKNKDINEGEEFRPRAVRDNFDDTHFTKIVVDGVEYLMTERDNNNPHEGFGFMAFRANELMEKQDSIMCYLRAIQHYQSKMYARMFNISEEDAQVQFENTFNELLFMESKKLELLESEELTNSSIVDESE